MYTNDAYMPTHFFNTCIQLYNHDNYENVLIVSVLFTGFLVLETTLNQTTNQKAE